MGPHLFTNVCLTLGAHLGVRFGVDATRGGDNYFLGVGGWLFVRGLFIVVAVFDGPSRRSRPLALT